MQVMVLEWLAADQPQTYKLMDKQTIRIGRHPECEIVFSDRRISRHHAELYARDGRFQIRTLSQTNIIAVNGLQRLHYNETAPLRAGDVFRVGEVHIRVKTIESYDDQLVKLRCPSCGRALGAMVTNCPYCGAVLDLSDTITPEP
jgi:predicted component of type VI protein secretion system